MNEHKGEIRALNGLRGIAALSVALGHYEIGTLVPGLAHLGWWKATAVDLFFCLSGFTLGLAYRAGIADALRMRDYLVARVARIYPLYFLTFLIFVFVGSHSKILTHLDYTAAVRDYIGQLTMTNAWPLFGTWRHLNNPAWSLSVEVFCYLFIFPVLFYASPLAKGFDWRVKLLLATGLAAANAYVLFAFSTGMVFVCRRSYCDLPESAYLAPLLRGVFGFSAGWVIYLSFMARDRLWRWATRHADMVTLGVLMLMGAGITGLLPIQVMILGFPLLVLGVSAGGSRAGKVLSWGPVHYLGSISYSMYLMHLPWALAWRWLYGLGDRINPHVTPPMAGVLVGGMLLVSALSYHAFEMPLRRVIRAVWQARADKAVVKPDRSKRLAGWTAATAALVLAVFGAAEAGVFRPIPVQQVRLGDDIARYPVFERAAWKGWGTREDWGIWSVSPDALLVLRLPEHEAAPEHLGLFVKGSFYLAGSHSTLAARILVNDVEIGAFRPVTANPTIETTLPVPVSALPPAGGQIRIRLLIDSPASPRSLGQSSDTRELGFGLQSMKLVAD